MITTLELVPLWQSENYVKTQSIMCRSCVDHVSIMCRSRADHASIRPQMETAFYTHCRRASSMQYCVRAAHESRAQGTHNPDTRAKT